MAWVARARPNWSSICGAPGSFSRARISDRIAAASKGCECRLANTHLVAAWASSRCSPCPARSQSARRSPGVTSTAVAAAGGPAAVSRPSPAAQIEVALPQPCLRAAGRGWESLGLERVGRYPVARRGADGPGPPAHLGPGHRVKILPAPHRVHNVSELLVAESPLYQHER